MVTLDADFHALLALSGASGPSVVRLRVEGLRSTETAALILNVLSACGEDLASGAMVSTDGVTARARRLPLGP